jgi:hypothetical protein
MVYLAFAAVCAYILSVWLFVRHLRLVQDRHHLQVSSLLNRIQAPEAAVRRELAPDGDPLEPVLHDDDEGFWDALRERGE